MKVGKWETIAVSLTDEDGNEYWHVIEDMGKDLVFTPAELEELSEAIAKLPE